jgi:hypothetical protein
LILLLNRGYVKSWMVLDVLGWFQKFREVQEEVE